MSQTWPPFGQNPEGSYRVVEGDAGALRDFVRLC